jgi:hypothetical protein
MSTRWISFWRIVASGVILLCLVFAISWPWMQHWYAYKTGTICGPTGLPYCYWSGFGSVFPWSPLALTGVFGWLVLQYKRYNCHDPEGWLPWGCWRLGKYEAAGGTFKLCRHHHPDLMGKELTRELIHKHHALHKARQERRLL